ncbi:MAG: NADP-dependent isocitrate dehydrogenase [Spirochaetales bacterium]|nr:NADP-dependent isocitrate dehydrogenase [Spirochaetales bacterium]
MAHNAQQKIIYTYTDEAPMLATHSLLPIIRGFSHSAGIEVELKDISLAGRILAAFPEAMPKGEQAPDALAELGELVHTPSANIIKLPNISASIPQIQAAIAELRTLGFSLPDFPENPQNEEEQAIRARYEKVKGSAVNPVLREGNSDRRSAAAVKAFAKSNPHSMGQWSPTSKTRVASMRKGDFYNSERSLTLPSKSSFRIEFVANEKITILKEEAPLEAGEILDAAVMRRQELDAFLKEAIEEAAKEKILFSVHLKATMMKVSDPIIFGRALRAYFAPLFENHSTLLDRIGFDANHGLGDLEAKMASLSPEEQDTLKQAIQECYDQGPDLAMVDSDRGITNLHVPSDVIIDASMPAAIRIGGKMWDKEGNKKDMMAVIPDRSYAGIYAAAIEFCKAHGAFDPATMGSVANVGLMARKAEEYGSHDKTFVAPEAGRIRAVDHYGRVLLEHDVLPGDLYRMCQTKDDAVKDWVKLAVKRARLTQTPVVFWLDSQRAHDAEIILKVQRELAELDTEGLEIQTLAPQQACHHALARCKNGEDTISATGNVLRDYLTDLFPILELGTSAKMLSIVPLMKGGGLFETGAGGSAPKHVRQLLDENHLRWDSLGEFLALTVSYEHLAAATGNKEATLLGKTLDMAVEKLLKAGQSPSRKAGEADNRTSHFHLALHWAQELSSQKENPAFAEKFTPTFQALKAMEEEVVNTLNQIQGKKANMNGYYRPSPEAVDLVMRPCPQFNAVIDAL